MSDPQHDHAAAERHHAKRRSYLRYLKREYRVARAKNFLTMKAQGGWTEYALRQVVTSLDSDLTNRQGQLWVRVHKADNRATWWGIRCQELRDRYWEWLKTN